MPLTVGELARRCGLTVRALHHYDAIGPLKPSLRSDAGYRLYDPAPTSNSCIASRRCASFACHWPTSEPSCPNPSNRLRN